MIRLLFHSFNELGTLKDNFFDKNSFDAHHSPSLRLSAPAINYFHRPQLTASTPYCAYALPHPCLTAPTTHRRPRLTASTVYRVHALLHPRLIVARDLLHPRLTAHILPHPCLTAPATHRRLRLTASTLYCIHALLHPRLTVARDLLRRWSRSSLSLSPTKVTAACDS